jgi:hypothetical protein
MPSSHWMALQTLVARTVSVVAGKWPVQTLARPRGIYGEDVRQHKRAHAVNVQLSFRYTFLKNCWKQRPKDSPPVFY